MSILQNKIIKYVVIEKEQDISIDELEKELKFWSKKYREILYKNGEFQEEINLNGFYGFISCYDNEDILSEIQRNLRESNIISTIYDEENLLETFKKSITILIKESIDNGVSETSIYGTMGYILIEFFELSKFKVNRMIKKGFANTFTLSSFNEVIIEIKKILEKQNILYEMKD